MPSVILWAFWIIGLILSIFAISDIQDEDDDSWGWPWMICYLFLLLLSIWWYVDATKKVNALPDICERIGVVENTELPDGKRISIVKSAEGIVNLSDSFKGLLTEGWVYTRCRRPDTGGGIYFVGNRKSWMKVEGPKTPEVAHP